MTRNYKDQIGRVISTTAVPRRIISVVPSQTELLHYLGLENEVVGITKFCVHPGSWFRSKERVGGTKHLNLEKIKSLQPDLILANKEENVQEQIEALAEKFPVWVSDINTMHDALAMIQAIGQLVDREKKTEDLVHKISSAFAGIGHTDKKKTVCYMIWKDPYMTVGGDTFIHDMLSVAGYENIFRDSVRYPIVDLTRLQADPPEYIFLSTEPFPFKEQHINALQPLFPHTRILIVDGEYFSWYGSRMLYAAEYFKQLEQQIASIV